MNTFNYPELRKTIQVVKQLLDPVHGCPWDLKQTHKSLLPYLLEESYEFIYAVEHSDTKNMAEELGDILLQVLLHCSMAAKEKTFDLETVSRLLKEKLIERHPHVFNTDDTSQNLSASEVRENWEKIKANKKSPEELAKKKLFVTEKQLMFPGLQCSMKIGKLAQELDFDWENHGQVLYKVEEEWQELKEELPPTGTHNTQRVEEELGDLLFSICQLARHLNLDPEQALKKSNHKFARRFNSMQESLRQQEKSLRELSTEEKEAFWGAAKNQAKS